MKSIHSVLIFYFYLIFTLTAQSQNEEVIDENYTQFTTLMIKAKKINEKKDNFSINERKKILLEAYDLTKLITIDTLRNKALYNLSLSFSSKKDSIYFRKLKEEGINLSIKLKDSSLLGNHYWDLGYFYQTYKRYDSTYFYYNKSQKILRKINRADDAAKLILRMARIQKDVRDYTGSEVTTTEAIKIYKSLNDHQNLYNCYNNLGIISNNLEEYDQAIQYHNDALSIIPKITRKTTKKPISLNNIGIVYRNLNNHKEAISKYEEALQHDSLYFKNTKLYATLMDNLAYSKFKLNDFEELPELFYKALHIRDSLEINAGIVVNKLHLAEYFLKLKDTAKALNYAFEGKKLAIKINSNDHLLDLYKMLAKIEPNNGSYYLHQHIQLNDSLVKHERTIRNKFTRIKFETDVVETENKKLSIQNNWIVAISSAVIFFSFLIYVITQQRTRNKELEMEQQQQLANEEIYNLMIDQQDKIEEGRKREKERISLELHDGILGRLFGTRLSLGSLNAKDDANSKKTREQYINELQSIEEEVRNISHELGLDNFDTTTSYSTMITNLLEEQSKITNFKYQIEDDNRIIWTDIAGHIKINIYRIIQESVQNINKYAKAQNVILDFKKNDNRIILTIKDDGIGFNQEKRSSGIGLKNMKSRVTLLHGQFTINSVPGKGTSISVDVPMT